MPDTDECYICLMKSADYGDQMNFAEKPSVIVPRPMRYFALGVLFTIVVLLIGCWLYLRVFSGELLDSKVSPDGRYLVEYRLDRESSATTTDVKSIDIHTQSNPFRHNLVTALDYGADLSVEWVDFRSLRISCKDSGGKLDFYGRSETKWRDISIRYDLDHCQIGSVQQHNQTTK